MGFLRWSVVVAVAVGWACGGGAPQPAALSSRWAAPSILSYVPADTPYLAALLDPVNEEMRRRVMQGADEQMLDSLRQLDRLSADPEHPEPWVRIVKALAEIERAACRERGE